MSLLTYILGKGGYEEMHRAALARVLRTLGGHAFDLPDAPAQTFAEEAEAIARTVEESSSEAHEMAITAPLTIARFVERRRKAEAEYVKTTIPGLRDAFFDVVRGVSESLGEDEREDLEVSQAMDALAAALVGGTPDQVKAKAEAAIGAVKESLQRRKRRGRAQIERMGRQLKEMQARVVEAEAKQSVDKLTCLPNRAALDQRLEQEVMVSHLTGEPLSVMMLDVDHFKRFNDTYGHAAGDRVLASVGEVLTRSFPGKSDFSARYGGEEFCVVMPNASVERARKLADRFRLAMKEVLVVHEGQELRVTCSAGVAELRARESATSMLGRADNALYAAKRAGRDRVMADLGSEGGVI